MYTVAKPEVTQSDENFSYLVFGMAITTTTTTLISTIIINSRRQRNHIVESTSTN